MNPSEEITLDTVVACGGSLVSADVGEELVLLHVEKNAYYDTDAIGADIWYQLEQPVRVSDLCSRLVVKYEVDPETCQRDVLAFLSEALREEVVRVVNAADPPLPNLDWAYLSASQRRSRCRRSAGSWTVGGRCSSPAARCAYRPVSVQARTT